MIELPKKGDLYVSKLSSSPYNNVFLMLEILSEPTENGNSGNLILLKIKEYEGNVTVGNKTVYNYESRTNLPTFRHIGRLRKLKLKDRKFKIKGDKK